MREVTEQQECYSVGAANSEALLMIVSTTQARALSKLMVALAEPCSEAEVRTRVGKHLLELLEADYVASYTWDPLRLRFASRISLNMSDKNLDAYDAYYQFRDPITAPLRDLHAPCLVEQVIAQGDLVRTEFFNDFLQRDGLYWGVNFYAWDGKQNIGDMRIWRSKKRDRFEPSALELLKIVEPAFSAALKRCKQVTPAQKPETPSRSGALSDRERTVAQLAALGLPDKEIAQKLGIGFTTVRTHLARAFQKLNVDNRVQLVARMMSLRSGTQ
jgi:DNA-binding CsgD family transcriptional regulator